MTGSGNFRHFRLVGAGALLALAIGCVAPLPVGPSTRFVREVDSSHGIIANELIVRIRPGTVLPVPHELLSPGMALVRSADAAAATALKTTLQQAEGVIDLAPNRLFRAVVAAAAAPDPWRSRQWALDVVGAEALEQLPPGRQIKVAVLDTGVDRTHADLVDVTLPGFTVMPTGPALGMDDEGHGTHVAGLIGASIRNGIGIAGISDRVRILPVKVLDSDGSGTLDDVIRGLAYAKSAGAQVVNLSLSAPASSTLERQAIRDLVDSGVAVVAAAGNEGSNQPMSPAALPGVIAVGATDPADARAAFSSYGAHVTLAAPGKDIISAVPGNAYRSFSGTSQATPLVSGIIASILSVAPGTPPAVIRDLLYHTGAPTTGFDRDVRRVDLNRLVAFVRSQIPATPVPATPAPATPAPATPAPATPAPAPATPVPATPTPQPVPTMLAPIAADPLPTQRPGNDFSNLVPVADGSSSGGQVRTTPVPGSSAAPESPAGFVWVPDFGSGSGPALAPRDGGSPVSSDNGMVPVVSPWW
ncbi:MAG: S8 family serine peptidase [Candidatus Sericytochromatia bacterium]|nr:S8 family serine peptidase [Candidatus Sericytochromatia bacterium]